MKKIKYLFQLSILFSYVIISTGCYTIINSPLDETDNADQIVEESESDSLTTDGSYTIINNYTCSHESSCCGHDYCHTYSDSHYYHSCDGHCALTFNWWAGTWTSYSCNYCHHWSCSGHHHGHFYGHGYFHHDYYHDGYYYGYHDGFYDGYWWGYNDGWWNSGGNDDDYSDWDDDQIERRENSFDRTETDDDFESQAITFENRSPGNISNDDNFSETDQTVPDKKYNNNSNSAAIISPTINSKENKNSRVEKRNDIALNIAQFLFTSYVNSNESSIHKSKSSKKNRSSSYKSKSSKKNKSSTYKSKSSKKSRSSSYSSKSKSSKKSSSKSSKSSKKSSSSKRRSRS